MAARQVDDRETPHAERHAAIDHHALIIRPAMRNHAAHPVEHGPGLPLTNWAGRSLRYKSCDSTHLLFLARVLWRVMRAFRRGVFGRTDGVPQARAPSYHCLGSVRYSKSLDEATVN